MMRGRAFGLTAYAADFFLPEILYAKVLRSRFPLRELSPLTLEGRAITGVKAVLTAKMFQRMNM